MRATTKTGIAKSFCTIMRSGEFFKLRVRDLDFDAVNLDFIMKQQEPYPALVVDGSWNIVMGNGAARRIFGLFQEAPAVSGEQRRNAMHMICHPHGIRRFITNWEEFAGPLLQMIHREIAAGGNTAARVLLDALLAYPEMPSRWSVPDPLAPVPPVLTMRLEKDDVSLAFFSTLTMLATPRDITLEQLKIECFYPADSATDTAVRDLAPPSFSAR